MKWRHCVVLLIVAMLFLTSSVGASAEAILELPANLEVIEEEAFYGATSIGQVVLPARTREIQAKAFANSSLTEIDIPNPSIEIAENAFDNHSANLVIRGYSGSTAETYASTHNIRFALLEANVVLTQSWEDFASASSSLVQNYEGTVSVSSEGSAYANGRLIVKMDGDLPDISQFSPEVIVRDPENHYLIQFSDSDVAESCAEYLNSAEGVIYVEPDQNLSGTDMGTDDYEIQSYSWGVSATNADAYAADLRKRGKTNQVVVAVVDTGVESSHPLLSGRLVNGYDFVENDATPQDGNSHGTHVSGTVVDCTPGLKVYIMPVRVLNNSGRGTDSGVAQGIRYAARNNANVINMSLGGEHSNYIDEAVEFALQRGVTVVVAAGNESENTSNHCPAHINSCITVSAVNQSQQRAYFSNYGNAVDIAAPGVSITSAVLGGTYGSKSGTSMATPHVSAAVAMLLCDTPGLSPSSVESMLRNAATDLGTVGWDAYYGAGFLNLEPFIKSGPQQYTVSYDANGGTGAPASQTKVNGVSLTLSSVKPTRANTSAGSYTVTFDANVGSGNPASLNAARTTSYTFKNWNTAVNGGGTSYASGATYSTDASMTLYAQWNSNTTTASITLPTLARDGYTFKGWSTSSTATSGVTGQYTPSSNITLYAVWEFEVLSSGTWGNLNWTLGKNGLLTISGEGTMNDFEVSSFGSNSVVDAWLAYKDSIITVAIQPGITSVGAAAFWYCNNLTSISFPSTVIVIGSYAFYNCTAITDLSIPNRMINIGTHAFDGCSSLNRVSTFPSNIVLPSSDNLGWLDDNAFANCGNITSVVVPDGIKWLHGGAFESRRYGSGGWEFVSNSSLTSITIPVSVTMIGCSFPEKCSRLTDVYYSGTSAQWDAIIGDGYNVNQGVIHYYKPDWGNITIHYGA